MKIERAPGSIYTEITYIDNEGYGQPFEIKERAGGVMLRAVEGHPEKDPSKVKGKWRSVEDLITPLLLKSKSKRIQIVIYEDP